MCLQHTDAYGALEILRKCAAQIYFVFVIVIVKVDVHEKRLFVIDYCISGELLKHRSENLLIKKNY